MDNLQREIIKLSKDKFFDIAVKEWDFSYEYRPKERTNCQCGKENIHKVFVYENRITHEIVELGENCARRMFTMTSRLSEKQLKDKKLDDFIMGIVCEAEREGYSDLV